MSKKNIALLDANILVRFLIGDGGKLYDRSIELFKQIEAGDLKVKILEPVLAEVVYVLQKVYQVPRPEIMNSLTAIIEMKSIKMDNKSVSIRALDLFYEENIDFVDALLCAYHQNTNTAVISFDDDVNKIT